MYFFHNFRLLLIYCFNFYRVALKKKFHLKTINIFNMRLINVKKTVFICKIDQSSSFSESFALLINGTAKKQLNIKIKLITI